ncbi:hypothetical protein UFOVP129_74 [uncultured Caudovirales phage]|uniref:Uncharacterized protein n=1 Tax=uncultured Caudovirales phage TaxID=2100421 RepID=A0A6J5LIB4_9CAUD|nr:hypothetical protein UFOVP129_74 [uncultured Caudovirales phage]
MKSTNTVTATKKVYEPFTSTREAFFAMNELTPQSNYFTFVLRLIESEKQGTLTSEQYNWICAEFTAFEAEQPMI